MILTHAKTIGIALMTALGMTTGLVLASGQFGGFANPPERKHQEGRKAAAPRTPTPRAEAPEETKVEKPSSGDGEDAQRIQRERIQARRNKAFVEGRSRIEIAGLAAAVAAIENDPANQAVLKKLDRPLTMSFAHPTPLKKVLEYIKSSLAQPEGKPIPIYINPIDPEGAEGSRLDWPVTIDLEGVPLKTSLRLILKQCGLAYCVRDGVLIIGSVSEIREELAEAVNEARGKDPQQRQQVMDMATQGMGMGGIGGGMR